MRGALWVLLKARLNILCNSCRLLCPMIAGSAEAAVPHDCWQCRGCCAPCLTEKRCWLPHQPQSLPAPLLICSQGEGRGKCPIDCEQCLPPVNAPTLARAPAPLHMPPPCSPGPADPSIASHPPHTRAHRNLTAAATTFVVTLPVMSQPGSRQAARAWEAALLRLIQVGLEGAGGRGGGRGKGTGVSGWCA